MSSLSKVKFRQASNQYKRVVEAVKLAFVNTTRKSTWMTGLGFSRESGPECIPLTALKDCEPKLPCITAYLFIMCL